MAQFDFNPAEVPASSRPDPVPPGDYLMQVISSERKRTKKDDGDILVITSQIMEGPFTNRLVWDNLNVHNPSEEAERISKRSLADLCQAVGINVLHDTEELHFKPFKGRLTIRHDKKGEYEPQNSIRYRPRDEAQTAPPPRQAPQQVNPSQPPRVLPTAIASTRGWQKPRI